MAEKSMTNFVWIDFTISPSVVSLNARIHRMQMSTEKASKILPTSQTVKSSSDGVGAMLLSVLLFSLGHAAVKWVPHIPFYQLVFLRALITAVICVFIIKTKKMSLKGNNLRLLLARGLAGTVALTAYFYSLQHMPLASAVTIQYLSPILTLIGAHFFLKEKANGRQTLAFALAFVGVMMVKGFDPRISGFVLTISLISIVASATAYNLIRVLRHHDHELIVVLYFPLVTLPLVGPFAIQSWVWPSLQDWGFILVVGVFTQLAQVFMTIAYHRRQASDVAVYNYLGILIALAIGYYFFNESFSFLSLFGMGVITAAVLYGSRSKPALQSPNA